MDFLSAAARIMETPIRLAINGAQGRVGQLLCNLVRADPGFDLLARCGSATDWNAVPALDVMVDFSTPAGLSRALAYCARHGVALVSGTTGLDAQLQGRLAEAAQHIAVLHAANFSLGIAVLTRLAREAARALSDWDLDIVEAHHAAKRDAPSGTALALGRVAADARGADHDAVATIDRSGARVPGSIGYATVRAGDIVGEHTLLLATNGERLELTHRAGDRTIFARGALAAARWIAGRAPGRYRLEEVIA